MKNIKKEIIIVKIVFRGVAIITLIVGLLFSYISAELDDAPGIIIIGTTATLTTASFVFGIGEIIIQLKRNNSILRDIQRSIDEPTKLSSRKKLK